jgi:tetratricopeptide (TPR) repeat protein
MMRWLVHAAVAFCVCAISSIAVLGETAKPQPPGVGQRDFEACANAPTNPDEAIKACTRLLATAPSDANSVEIYSNRGVGWYLRKAYDSAIADFNEALRRDPNNAPAYHNRGRAWRGKKDFDRAIADFSQTIDLDPRDIDAFIDRALSLYDKTEYSRAISDLDRVLRDNPASSRARLIRALCLEALSEFDRAISDLDEVIRLEPEKIDGYEYRAHVLRQKGDFDRAMADLDVVISREPKNWRGYSARGDAWRIKGDLDRAMRDLDDAIRLGPKEAQAYNIRALIWRDRRDFDKALADYDEAILLDANFALAYGNRSEIWRLKGNLGRSLLDANKAVSLSPKEPVFLDLRGDTLRSKEEWDKALADYDHAVQIDPNDVPGYVGRGLILEKKRDTAAARRDFEAALKFPASVDPSRTVPAQTIARVHLAGLDAETAAAETASARIQTEADRLKAQEERIKAEEERLKGEEARIKAESESLRKAAEIAAQSPAKPKPGVQTTPIQDHRVALVIGNSDYQNSPHLPNPADDAKAVADALRTVGFESVSLLLNSTREKTMDELRLFAGRVEKADWGVVYYSGHGVELDGANYLIPVEAKLASERDVQFEAIALDQVLAAVEPARKLRLVVLDACRDNPFLNRMRFAVTRRQIDRGLSRIEPDGGTLVVYAAKHGHVALDGEDGHSPFSTAFLKRVLMPGVEVNKLFRLIRDDVLAATSGAQEPFVYGTLSAHEDYYFVREGADFHSVPGRFESPHGVFDTPRTGAGAVN